MSSGRSTGKKIKTTRSYNDSLDYQLPVIPLFASSYFRHLSPFPIPHLPLPKENDRASSDHLLLKPET